MSAPVLWGAALLGWWLWSRTMPAGVARSGGGTAPGTTLVPGSGGATGAPPVPGPAISGPGAPGAPVAPVVSGFALSDQAQVKLGLTFTREVTKWFLTPVDVRMDLSPEAAAAWGDYKLGEQADYTSWIGQQSPAVEPGDLSVAANSDTLVAVQSGEGLTGEAGAALVDGTVEAVPVAVEGMSNLTVALQGFGVAAAMVDMGFTIAGKLPDAEKAVIAALDTAIAASLFIPVYGWAVGLVLGIVRGMIGLLGTSLFGAPDMSHAQREALEVARTASQGLNPWMQQVAGALTPRELVPVLIQWTTGYCGGMSSVAVMTYLRDPAPSGATPYVGAPGCYLNQGVTYHEWPNMATLDRDGWALALTKYGPTEAGVSVQAGVAQHFKDDMNSIGLALLQKRLAAWHELMQHGATLDTLDALAAEQRATPRWNAVAAYFGAPDWHTFVGTHVQDAWTRYLVTNRSGGLADFAHRQGYASWLAMRDAVMIQAETVMHQEQAARAPAPVVGVFGLATTV